MKYNESSVAILFVAQVHRSLLCLDPHGIMQTSFHLICMLKNAILLNIYPECGQWALSLQQLLDMTGDGPLPSLCSALHSLNPYATLPASTFHPICHQTHRLTSTPSPFYTGCIHRAYSSCTESLITDQTTNPTPSCLSIGSKCIAASLDAHAHTP